jgi:uncharacterized protein UPF0489
MHEHKIVAGKDVYIVSSHHHVLLAWAEIRKGASEPPNLITLDQHTDTHEPFLGYVYAQFGESKHEAEDEETARSSLIQGINIRNASSIVKAIHLLRNDEHIQTATLSGILNVAFVTSFEGRATESEDEKEYDDTYPFHTRRFNANIPSLRPRPRRYTLPENRIFVLPHECWVGCNARPHNDECNYKVSCKILEADYLERQLGWAQEMAHSVGLSSLLSKPYILDLDLDFFHTEKSLAPDDPSVFHKLIRGAEAITIATEEEWTESCWLDAVPPQIDLMLQAIYDHVETASGGA